MLNGEQLVPWLGGMHGRLPGEIPHARWVGPRGTLFARDFSKFRHWQLLLDGRPLIVDVTSQRLRVIPGADSTPLRSIRRIEPRARDLSVLDIKFRGGNRLRLWGENVPELTVMLGWLLWRRVIAVPGDPTYVEAGPRS